MSEKIIQIVVAPNGHGWTGQLLGLGSDGVVYEATGNGDWQIIIGPLTRPEPT